MLRVWSWWHGVRWQCPFPRVGQQALPFCWIRFRVPSLHQTEAGSFPELKVSSVRHRRPGEGPEGWRQKSEGGEERDARLIICTVQGGYSLGP